ncbi:MAG: glyoxalase/bleomycin resistance/dioxygenase family protein [Cellulosilyticaceae bacterium]
MKVEFKVPLLAVKDIEASKRFYKEIFGQEVVLDFGKNVTFNGGFSLQEDFAWLTDVPMDSIIEKSHNMELYFEVDSIDEFMKKLEMDGHVKYVHPLKEHEWKQRVIRIYDLDGHMIEIGESMVVVAKRYLDQGCSVEETAKIIQHPIEFVEQCQ